MQFISRSVDPLNAKQQCLLVGLYENQILSPTASLLDHASKGHISKILKQGDIKGKVGESLLLHFVPGTRAARVLLVGLGKETDGDGPRFIQIASSAVAAVKKTGATSVLCCLTEAVMGNASAYWKTRRLVEQFYTGIYRYDAMRGKPDTNAKGPTKIDVLVSDKSEAGDIKKGIKDGVAIGIGSDCARDLGNTPGNVCTPTYLADTAKQLARDYPSLTTSILDEAQMEKLGMGCLLSVSHGSAEPAKLIVIRHKGGKPKQQPHVLVGKGITFDTGGISIKPAANMEEMIYDMCGAASVMGTMKTVAELNLPINVIGVIAAAENMPSGTASRPGDIVTSMSGQTVEIINTDAEGRLVLCDALTYVDKFNPDTVIDIATLTGACVEALGAHASAMYANDETLATNLNAASDETQDRIWRMPLWDDYQVQLNSAFADMTNTGGRAAGSVTAACFLARYTKKYRWAHLDIAGTANKGSGSTKTATGRPVNLLSQYLMDRARNKT